MFRTRGGIGRWVAGALALFLLAGTAAAGDEESGEKPGNIDRRRQAIEGLERGIHALETLGRHDEAERLRRILREEVERVERADHHGEMARRHLEIFRLAIPALREAERRDAAHQLERAIHAMELASQGRHEDAERALRDGPSEERILEILALAARLWREEFRKPDRAEQIERLVREGHGAHPREGRDEARERHEGVRIQALIEVLRVGMHAFREKEEFEATERLEQAVHALELMRGGRRDEEARRIVGRAPGHEEVAKLLRHAAEIWDGFGHERKAAACRDMAGELLASRERAREREPDRRREEVQELRRRLEELERREAELRKDIERLRRALD